MTSNELPNSGGEPVRLNTRVFGGESRLRPTSRSGKSDQGSGQTQQAANDIQQCMPDALDYIAALPDTMIADLLGNPASIQTIIFLSAVWSFWRGYALTDISQAHLRALRRANRRRLISIKRNTEIVLSRTGDTARQGVIL